jgi:bifunctional non-homologous end joining protein LigD
LKIKFDGYRMHARLDRERVQLLTRKGLDWTRRYPTISEALKTLPAEQAYLDGELCGLRPDGTTAFDIIQNAAEPGHAAALVFFLFDLLFLDGEDLTQLPLTVVCTGPATDRPT